jgi:polysaccharide export outer membrane protein
MRFILLPCLLLLLAACTSSDVSTVSTQEFVKNTRKSSGPEEAKLVAGDSIEVSVEVDGRMEVMQHRAGLNHMGFVTLPLVGDVKVGGKTLDQARSAISNTYGKYYVNEPVVMVSLTSEEEDGQWGYITVMGRVERPGRIALLDADGMTLSEAVQSAGGFAPSAKQSDIRISRQDKSGKKLQVSVDFNDIGQAGSAEADINLIGGDIVYVPERIF